MSRRRPRLTPLPTPMHPDTVRVDRIVQNFLLRLSGASSSTAIGEILTALGAQFRLPYLYLGHNRKTPDGWQRQRIIRSQKAPIALLRALAAHPMAQAASESRRPVTLTELNSALAGRDVYTPDALKGVESLLISVETAPDAAIVAVYSGRGAVVNGLTESLLTFATHLAVSRLTLPAWPVRQTLHDLTDREREVIALAKAGLPDAEIGRRLNLATRTIRYHLTKAMERTGIARRTQLIAKASSETL